MTDRIVSFHREVAATAERIFELIADPAHQPSWDGNDNLAEAPANQRVHGTGEVRRIAWLPSPVGKQPPGHLWRWELEPIDETRTTVTHTYDWSGLTDESRLARARKTTAAKLQASVDRLAELAES